MSRRLVNRAGSQRHGRGPTIEDDDPPTPNDVEYEPPSFPLNEQARAKLGDLSRTRETSAYQNQMKEALRNLGLSVYDIQQRLSERRERLEQLRTRRQERGLEKSSDEERLEAHILKMEQQIGPLTDQSEAAVRHVIDLQVELQEDGAILGHLYTKAAMNNQNRQTETQNSNQEEAPTMQGTISELHSERKTRKENYEATAPSHRYAQENEYIAFKKLWRDGLAGEDGPPLPDASKWFRQDGTPVMGISIDRLTGGNDDDSDEDVAVAREVISLNCPLTLRPLVEPFSNRKCKHTFEKSAIMEYLSSNRPMQCPQTGCSQVYLTSRLVHASQTELTVCFRCSRDLNSKPTSILIKSSCGEYRELNKMPSTLTWTSTQMTITVRSR